MTGGYFKGPLWDSKNYIHQKKRERHTQEKPIIEIPLITVPIETWQTAWKKSKRKTVNETCKFCQDLKYKPMYMFCSVI